MPSQEVHLQVLNFVKMAAVAIETVNESQNSLISLISETAIYIKYW